MQQSLPCRGEIANHGLLRASYQVRVTREIRLLVSSRPAAPPQWHRRRRRPTRWPDSAPWRILPTAHAASANSRSLELEGYVEGNPQTSTLQILNPRLRSPRRQLDQGRLSRYPARAPCLSVHCVQRRGPAGRSTPP